MTIEDILTAVITISVIVAVYYTRLYRLVFLALFGWAIATWTAEGQWVFALAAYFVAGTGWVYVELRRPLLKQPPLLRSWSGRLALVAIWPLRVVIRTVDDLRAIAKRRDGSA